MTEQVLGMLGKLDERSIRSIIWVTLEQAKLISIYNNMKFIGILDTNSVLIFVLSNIFCVNICFIKYF